MKNGWSSKSWSQRTENMQYQENKGSKSKSRKRSQTKCSKVERMKKRKELEPT